MSFEIAAVPESEKTALWDMLQDYIAELSVYAGVKPVDGVYVYEPFDKYWADGDRFPFWAIGGGVRAGFALVWRDANHDVFRMAEFYVRPEDRGSGASAAFARGVIERFSGAWKVRQIALNVPAVKFWRRALAPYRFTEENFFDRGLERVEQSFVISARKS